MAEDPKTTGVITLMVGACTLLLLGCLALLTMLARTGPL